MITSGYYFGAKLVVSGPHDDGKYHLVDGAHRMAAVEQLSKHENESIREIYSDFSFPCYVLPAVNHTQEMALAFGNSFY